MTQDVALLTTAEVARRLNVSPSTVRRMLGRGDIPSVKVGKLVRVRPADLSTYIDRHTRG